LVQATEPLKGKALMEPTPDLVNDWVVVAWVVEMVSPAAFGTYPTGAVPFNPPLGY
jgi:hypothetical protein